MTGPDYDYIIVGAGTAGCVLAARLTENTGIRVLLVEAGGGERTRAMIVPDAWPELLGSDADWADVTTGQAEAGPGIYPRGRALGGSGAINAMAHTRGHRAIYDGWGVPGWGFADLLPYFRRSETAVGRDPARSAALRGTSGPVRVAPVPEADRHPVARAFAEALVQAGCPATDDLSGERQEGVAWADLAIAGGQRVSPADAYLRPVLDRPNLTVRTGCLVTRLEVRHGRCTGVSYLRDGARTSGEVIVCAGAIGTPQLLMLSGLGPAGHLRALGIEQVADLPAVGSNLQDHPVAMACYASPEPLPRSRYNHGEVYAALRSPLAGACPDIQLFPVLLPVVPAGRTAPDAGFALLAAVTAPDSRGTVRLASPDPQAAPLIDPGFLRDGRDLDRLAAGLALIREVTAFPEVATFPEVWPGAGAGMRDYIRHTVGSYYHPAGSCRIGADPAGAVDPDLRVHGINGLRIADASVLPVIPNAPLNATVLAVAEQAAELIRTQTGSAR